MKCITPIIKRRGHTEKFDEKKAYASVYFAARTTHYSEQKAEDIAKKTLTQLTKHCTKKKTMTSKEIFKFITSELKKHDKDVAYMYSTHMDIS